jgi:hypothetical protein
MLLSVVDGHLVDALTQAMRAVLRDPLTLKTGIGFVIDVDRVFGMEPYIKNPGSRATPPSSRTGDHSVPATGGGRPCAPELANNTMLYTDETAWTC